MTRQLLRRLAAEVLETRTLMAGDVAASIEGGILYLRGDDASNGVVIRNAAGGNIEVVGVPAGGSATTVNGSASFTAEGVTLGVSAVMGRGNDLVRFANTSGQPVALPGAVVVDAGIGHDRIAGRISNTAAVTFNLGPGNDQVSLGGSSLGTLVIEGDFPPRDNAAAGNDRVSLNSVRAARAGVIRTGGGNDVVEITGNSAFPLSLTINTDNGDDRVEVVGGAQPISVGGALTVNTGAGDDTVNIERVTVRGVAVITTLQDDDDVTIDHLVALDGLYAYLGGGGDSLEVRNSSGARAVLLGGFGVDTLVLENNNFPELIRVSF